MMKNAFMLAIAQHQKSIDYNKINVSHVILFDANTAWNWKGKNTDK